MPERSTVEEELVGCGLVLVICFGGWHLPHLPSRAPHAPRQIHVLNVQRTIARIETGDISPRGGAHHEARPEEPVHGPILNRWREVVRRLENSPSKRTSQRSAPHDCSEEPREATCRGLRRTSRISQQWADQPSVRVLMHGVHEVVNTGRREYHVRVQDQPEIGWNRRQCCVVILSEAASFLVHYGGHARDHVACGDVTAIAFAVTHNDYPDVPVEVLPRE